MLALKSLSFACQLHNFLEERDKLLLDLFRLVVRHFAVEQRVGHELLYVRGVRGDTRALRYRSGLIAFVHGVLDFLRGHIRQLLGAGHEHLNQRLYHLDTSFQMLVLFDSPSKAAV